MAFGSLNGGEQHEMADINVTPLVDVMLVLMIVFMIAMPVFTSSIKVQLPKSSTQEQLEKGPMIRVVIKQNGEYFIDDEMFTLASVQTKLAQLASDNRNAVIAIQADKQADYEYVAGILDEARRVGLTKIGFVTEVKQ